MYGLFVIFFAIIAERSRYARSPYYNCGAKCSSGYVNDYWYEKHGEDSYTQFWAAGLACFIVGAYQVGSSMVMHGKLLKEWRKSD